MTGAVAIPKEPGDHAISVDGYTIVKIKQFRGSWFLYDYQGHPIAQTHSYLQIRREALEMIGTL